MPNQRGNIAMPRPSGGRHRPSSWLLVLLALLVGAEGAVDLTGGGGGASATVPCSQLPELKHLALKVAILGSCR